MPRIIRPLSPNPRIKDDDDATVARYGDLEWLYAYITKGGGSGTAIAWKGTWSNLTAYIKNDTVFFNGSSYICTSPVGPSNTNPSVDIANWDILALEGTDGAPGAPGATGATGPAGATGAQGPTGAAGAPGATGPQGPAGANGTIGATGPQGATGPAGPIGPAGLNWQGAWSAPGTYVVDDAVAYGGASYFCINAVGPSATTPDLDPGNWALLAAQGAIGPQGPIGATGAAGATGAVGPTGPTGPAGAQGPQGIQGIQGIPGPAGSGSVVAANAIYVSKSGNDTTGVRDNLGLSFFTIEAALAVAVAGDTIVVFPGDFELSASLVLKNDVNFYFIGQGKVTLLLSVLQPIFQDSNTAVTCNIFAPDWTFEGRGVTGNPTNNAVPPLDRGYAKGVIRLKKASDVTFTADKIISEEATIYLKGSQGTAVEPSYVGATVPKIRITANVIEKKYFNQAQFDCCIGAEFAEFEVNAGDILQTYSTPYVNDIEWGNILWKKCKTAIINANRIINYNSDGLAVYQDGAWENDVAYITASLVKSGYGWTLWAAGNGNITHAKVDRVESRGDCCVIATGAVKPIKFTLEGATIYSDVDPTRQVPSPPFTDGIVHCEVNGTLTLIGCKIERSPATANYAGWDVLSDGANTIIELQNTSYNSTKVRKDPAGRNGSPTNYGQVKSWNGTAFIETPYISKYGETGNFAPNNNLFSSIEKSTVEEGLICYNGYTNCVIRNCNIYDGTVVFTANSQVIENLIINKNVLISPPPFQSVNYGTTTSLTKFVNLQVGASGSGATTVNLPACAIFNGSISSNTLTVSSVTSGTLGVNQIITGAGIADDTIIIGPGAVAGQWKLSRAVNAPLSVTAARASYAVNNKVIVTDLGAGGGVITVDAGSNARIVGTSQSQTYTLNPGEVAEFVLSKTDSGNFLWKLLEIPSLTAGNAVYVSKTGNDSTGTRNVLSKQFATIAAGLAAAQSGDTVVVFPGEYELADQLVLRDDVHFEFLGEGLLQLATGVNKNIFQDTLGVVNCKINAPGWTFEGRGTTITEIDNGVIKLTLGSTVVFNAYKLVAQKTCIRVGDQNTIIPSVIYQTLTLTAKIIQSTVKNSKGPIWATSTYLTITADDILNADSDDEYNPVIKLWHCPYVNIKAKRAINFGVDGQIIYVEDSAPGDKYYFDIDYMQSGTGWTVWISGDNEEVKAFITSKYIVSSGDCTIVNTSTDTTITGATILNNKTTAPVDGILHAEFSGKLTAIGCTLIKGPGTVGEDVYTTGGILKLVNTTYDRKSYSILPSSPGEILNWNGTDFLSYKEVTIDSTALSTLFTSPVILLDAPAATEYYVIDKILLEYDHVAGTASAGGDFVISDDYYKYATIEETFIEQSEDTYIVLNPSPSTVFSNVPKYQYGFFTSTRDIKLKMLNNNPTNLLGASMKVKIWYRTETKG